MKYFDENTTLWDITSSYPETIPVFVSNGFPLMQHEKQREKFAKSITLETALMLKQLDVETFSKLLREAIEQDDSSVDVTLANTEKFVGGEGLSVVGLLPCPVRIPLLERFNGFVKQYSSTSGVEVNHELKAASMGLEWVENNIRGVTDASDLPDLFISAGFDMFFDEKMIGKFKRQGVFKDTTTLKKFNTLFDGLDLKDPAGHYAMIGVVPAVFLVNRDELDGREIPRTWEDIMKPEFENRVSLPVGDFDLFNGILLNIHKHYGEQGVTKLGRSLLQSMHPSQMVKSDRLKTKKPIVTIMPYFFTKVVKEGGPMAAVWPEDGAIISPIFMLAKKQKIETLQPVVDFFASVEVGKILSHSGLFPSVHPELDNHISSDNKFMWLGWDYIYSNDISALITKCEALFNEATGK
ncbi:MAG: iron ABC transporter substrate-binding protein [Gemmatimonadaceae bacterium 4484_173]|nr:MAG: iron ABC transporter substrate-binding protein [Gemmatimonadaceae bacterium 4484_173]RKZ03908.1 MAG: iron ABC transporter substrate-binding protein [Candidatus Fermentibacteria bacterium]